MSCSDLSMLESIFMMIVGMSLYVQNTLAHALMLLGHTSSEGVVLVTRWEELCFPSEFSLFGVETKIVNSIQYPWPHFSMATSYQFSPFRTLFTSCVLFLAGMYITWQYYNNTYLAHFMVSPIGNGWWSKYMCWLESRVTQPRFATCTIRSLFNSSPMITNGAARNHTHPNSARIRNDGSSFMDAFGGRTGMTPYFVQQSAADVRHSRAGCRTYNWAKDLTVPQSDFNPPENCFLAFTDVEMHMDNLPDLLSSVFLPVVISTFQPSKVCKADGEYSYTFNSKNEVIYRVSGGAEYQHKVWKYGIDTLMTTSRRGFLYHHHIYNVDRRSLDADHELILLTPIKRLVSPFISLRRWLGHNELNRLEVVQKVGDTEFLRLSCQTANGLTRTTGKPGCYALAEVTAEQDDTLAATARVAKNIDITPAAVKTVVSEVSQPAATILAEYHRYKSGPSTNVVYPLAESVLRYSYNPMEYEIDAKPCVTPFMSPLTLGCFAPDKCYANDKAAIQGRVERVKVPDLPITAKMHMYMDEYSKFLIPVAHEGHPVDFTTVYDKQGRPTQRRILDAASVSTATTVPQSVQAFMKNETYEKPSEPRNISTIPGVNKQNYSRYIYSFTSVLRATKWYAFALKPYQVAVRVMMICMAAMSAVNTDLSRFDGRVSNVLRLLEEICMKRYFHTQYHVELNELMASQKGQKARTTFGYKYNTGNSRASGSSETADFNSFDNSFMAYVTYRKQGLSPQEAWDKLGIYGGDDGLSPDIDATLYKATCAEMGQVLEVETVQKGEIGISFLARMYSPGVWHGDYNSICDVRRQITKLHVTPSLPSNVTPAQKLAEKCYAYYLSDKNTPIIGEIASTLVNVFPELVPDTLNEHGIATHQAYEAKEDDGTVQYPNEDSANPWMEELVRKQLPLFDFAKMREWLSDIHKTRLVDMMLVPPICNSTNVVVVSKEPVVVNGVVENSPKAPPPAKARVEYTAEQLAHMAATPCSQIPNCKFGKKCRYKH